MQSKSQKSSSRLRNLKVVLEYDGSAFFGFQRQKGRPTIQEAFEKALSRLFNRPLKIAAAAGRTDAGVHAEGQVVNFKVESPLPAKKIQKGLNALFPKTIVVRKIEEVPPRFHARYDAKWKAYEYRVLNSEIRSPLLNGRTYQFPSPLDLKSMQRAARRLVGRHDFRAFQASGSSAKTSVRTIRRFRISKEGNLIQFVIEADGFLYHMVRNLVGTILAIGRGRLSPAEFEKMLREGNRPLAIPPAPAHALTLARVQYPRE